MEVDKSKLLDTQGRPLTQSLFLEIGYSKEYAYYTLKEYDHHWGGQVYPSLKRLYLEHGDPTEYDFASTYLLGWKQWQRLCDNAVVRKHIDEWREELELKIRSEAYGGILASASEGNFQANKWLADKGWEKKGAGRPSTKTKQREDELFMSIASDYGDDIARIKQ